MNPSQRTFKTRLRVRYAETDQMGVVYHANYFVWFEVGRVEMMRELGFAYKELEAEQGCVLPVVEVNCRYRAPARYDDELELETRLVALRGPVLKFGYVLRRAVQPNAGVRNGATSVHLPDLLAEAQTTHVVVDRAMRKRALPSEYASVLLAIL